MSKTPMPAGLLDDGASLWRKVTGAYALRDDELVTLEAACRAVDRIALMRAELGGTVTATGSMGQVVVHPLIPEIRAHEAQVSSMLARLKLPDVDGEVTAETASTKARAAAQSRWAQAHGKGA